MHLDENGGARLKIILLCDMLIEQNIFTDNAAKDDQRKAQPFKRSPAEGSAFGHEEISHKPRTCLHRYRKLRNSSKIHKCQTCSQRYRNLIILKILASLYLFNKVPQCPNLQTNTIIDDTLTKIQPSLQHLQEATMVAYISFALVLILGCMQDQAVMYPTGSGRRKTQPYSDFLTNITNLENVHKGFIRTKIFVETSHRNLKLATFSNKPRTCSHRHRNRRISTKIYTC